MRGMDGRVASGAAAVAVLAALVMAPGAETPSVQVIVRGGDDAAAIAVGRFGGEVLAELALIDGLVARVPADAVEALRNTPGVEAVTADATVELLGKPHSHDDDPASL